MFQSNDFNCPQEIPQKIKMPGEMTKWKISYYKQA